MENLDSKILLLDSSFNIALLKNTKITFDKIISFDFDSHYILFSNKISHEISDNYLDKYELEQIQKTAYSLSKWYQQEEISSFIKYDGINLGNLIHMEFMDYIVVFLKKFYELTKIVQKYNRAEFFVLPQLYNMTKLLTDNVHKLQYESETSEKVKYSYQFGEKSISLNISKKNYLKLKSISETIFQKLMKFDKVENQKKHILLVEFDPIRYKDLLFTAKESLQNILFYNRRRPTIWNKESFNVIKESKCKVATFRSLFDNELSIKIKHAQKKINESLKDLFDKEQFFVSFFALNGKSFWFAFKPFFVDLIKKRLCEAAQEIEIGKKLFEKYSISVILIFSEIGFNEQIMMNLARKNNVKVVMIQHGIPFETQEAFERNNLLGFFPNFSDTMFVWGNLTKKYIENSGFAAAKIIPVGNPIYDELFNKRNIVDGQTILLATSPPRQDLVYDNLIKTNEDYRNAIELICKIVLKLNRKLVIKLRPFVDIDIEPLIQKISKKITVISSGDIFSLIEKCSVLITFDLSTTILETQILKKPAISISLKDYGFGESEIFKTKSCVTTPIEDFEDTLNNILTNDSFRNTIIKSGDNFVDEYLVNKGTSCKAILDYLKSL